MFFMLIIALSLETGIEANCTDLQLGSSMTANVTTANFSESAEVTCDPGYALSVQHGTDPPIVNRVQLVQCKGNLTQQKFYWEDIQNCSKIQCADPPPGSKIIDQDSGNRDYNATILRTCESGHRLYLKGSFEITCNINATWEGGSFSCNRQNVYVGCFPNNTIDVTPKVNKTVITCRQYCKTKANRYAAISGANCYCGNITNSIMTELPNPTCNMTCIDTKEYYYCGGKNDEQSIFYSKVTGCYNLSSSHFDFFPVTGDVEKTCLHYCSGQDAFYAVLHYHGGNVCACTNYTYTDGLHTSDLCKTQNESDYYLQNIDDETKSTFSSCDDMFKKGIRTHGYYYINSQKTLCNFKDGTVCDDGWIGYRGSCYYFHAKSLSFAEATQFCSSRNATVASILSSEENTFISAVVQYFEDLQANGKDWYIGLYDENSVSAFAWNDGNILNTQYFHETEPSDEAKQCVMARYNKWYSSYCANKTNVICKQNNERLFCVQTDDAVESQWNITKSDLTLTMCIQACIARQFSYAVIKAQVCHCKANLPTHEQLSFEKCNSPCPGNSYQFCGGTPSNVYTVYNVSYANKAKSCEELQAQGLTGDIYMLDGSSTVTECEDQGCPYSWVMRNSSCYKLMVGHRDYSKSFQYCANHSSYLAVFESNEELNFIKTLASSISFYSGISEWKIGIFSPNSFSGVYRWANGIPYQKSLSLTMSNTFRQVIGSMSGSELRFKSTKTEYSYICEKGPEYLGCYRYDGFSVLVSTAITTRMTIEQCVESCKGMGFTLAMIMTPNCHCNNTLKKSLEFKDGCSNTACIYSQSCGDVNQETVSVYDTSYYPLYGSCLELFNQGIRINGYYNVSGETRMCKFADNTTCPSGWIGYSGQCYMQVAKEIAINDVAGECSGVGGTPAFIRDADEHTNIKLILKGQMEFTKTEVWIGQLDEFSMGITTWSSGMVSDYNPLQTSNMEPGRMMVLDVNSDFKFALESSKAHAVLCQLDAAHIGCYKTPEIYTPEISSYNSMEIGQCKQLCIGKSMNQTGFIMIQASSCYCISDLDGLEPSTNSKCTANCPGNRYQSCGASPSYVDVYAYGESDMVSNCSQLYNQQIWYQGLYRLNNSETPEHKTCGFFDDTPCGAGWFGKDGDCFRVYPALYSFSDAKTKCFQENGYIFSTSATRNNFIQKFLMDIPALAVHRAWWISVVDVFMSSKFLEGGGHVVYSNDWASEYIADSNNQSAVNITTSKWMHVQSASLPVICEKGKGYIGCKKDYSTTDTENRFTSAWMSATECIQYCIGLNATYAAIRNLDTCVCLGTSNFTDGYETDCQGCAGYGSQPCGSTSGHMSVFFLEKYENDTLQSCADLETVGLSVPGWYKTLPESSSTSIRTKCFVRTDPLQIIDPITIEYKASSELLQATEAIMIVPYTSDSTWMPSQSDSTPWLQLKFSKTYIVTGLSTQGRPSHVNSHWTSKYYITFDSIVSHQFETAVSEVKGNIDRFGVVYHYFVTPFATKKLKIHPIRTGLQEPALRLSVFGQDIDTFNYLEKSIGCYLFFNLTTLISHSTSDDAICASKCKLQSPFYTIKSQCYCIEEIDKYGRLDDSPCTDNNAFTVKRTQDLFCSMPPVVGNATNATTFAHITGIFTIKSNVKYTCNYGYEFPDKVTTDTITCNDSYVWDKQLKDCKLVTCDAIAPPLYGDVDIKDSVTYGTTVTATCEIGYSFHNMTNVLSSTCQADKSWNVTIENCAPIICGTPPNFDNTVRTGTEYTFGKKINYTCSEAMWFSTDVFTRSISCNENGTWDADIGNCSYYMCPSPPSIKKTTVIHKNTTATYKCQTYFRFKDGTPEKNVTCDVSTFTWETLQDECQLDESLITKKMGRFTDRGQYLRNLLPGDKILVETSVISYMECANKCLGDSNCRAFNYNIDKQVTSNNCKLYETTSESNTLTAHGKWKYFQAEEIKYV